MVEVFKTNVRTAEEATMLVNMIQNVFGQYTVNFDLDDCDNILRVKCAGTIEVPPLIDLVKGLGFEAEILPDEEPISLKQIFFMQSF